VDRRKEVGRYDGSRRCFCLLTKIKSIQIANHKPQNKRPNKRASNTIQYNTIQHNSKMNQNEMMTLVGGATLSVVVSSSSSIASSSGSNCSGSSISSAPTANDSIRTFKRGIPRCKAIYEKGGLAEALAETEELDNAPSYDTFQLEQFQQMEQRWRMEQTKRPKLPIV
jgi:hypothetical protein